MDPIALTLIVSGNLVLTGVFLLYFKKFQQTTKLHEEQSHTRERELKRKLLELSVLRSLGERVGYSLDLRQILEVITDSLNGLVEFSTASYMMRGTSGNGWIVFKARVEKPVSRHFLDQVKKQMLDAFSAMEGRSLHQNFVDETVSGVSLDERVSGTVGSFFNLPIIIGGKVSALITVSSAAGGLYGDDETAILYTIMEQVSYQATKLVTVVENEKRKLSAMIASLADGILMVDPKFNLLVVNRALSGMLGLKGEINLLDILTLVGTKADLISNVRTALAQQSSVRIPEFELSEKAVAIDIEPVKDRSGYVLGAVVVFRDMTPQKQLERLKDDFTAMMVHELRTPLTTITYGVENIMPGLSRASTEEVSSNLKIIKDTASNMLSLVNELLDVARIEAGKFEVLKKEDDLKLLIEEKVGLFNPIAQQKNLALVAETDPALSKIVFDKRRLGQALDNLVSNALKYTDAGSVTLQAKVLDGKAVVSVADSGEGIEAGDIPRLFSKFELLGKGKTGEKIGTGLGLVIAKGIVEAHGGKIWAESPGKGKGSIFSFSLPIN